SRNRQAKRTLHEGAQPPHGITPGGSCPHRSFDPGGNNGDGRPLVSAVLADRLRRIGWSRDRQRAGSDGVAGRAHEADGGAFAVTTDEPSPTDQPSEEPSDEPTEEPTDPESPEPTSPGGLDTDEPSDEPPEETNGEFPEDAQRDENAPIFTEHPAAMGSESLSFEGLSGISFVSVPTADGG